MPREDARPGLLATADQNESHGMPQGDAGAAFRQQDSAPTRKVVAAGVAGAVTTVLIFVLNNYVIPGSAAKITGDVGAAITTILSFAISYFVPPAQSDQIRPE